MLRHEGPLYEWTRFGKGYVRRLIELGQDHGWEPVASKDVPVDVIEQAEALTVHKREVETATSGLSGGASAERV